MVFMEIIKLGLNKSGIRGSETSYIHDKKNSIDDLDNIREITKKYISEIEEGSKIYLYHYDISIMSKLELIELIRQSILSERQFELTLMVFDDKLFSYKEYRIK